MATDLFSRPLRRLALRARGRTLAVAAACTLCMPLIGHTLEFERGESVEALKAQVLLRILMFVRWPDEDPAANRQLRICVAGESAFSKALITLDAQPVNDRILAVQKARPDQIGGCQVAYVANADSTAWAVPRGQAVLLIGDVQGALEHGAMLNLRLDGTHVVFDVGLGATRAAGIEISAKVLRMARFVKED